MKLKNLLKENPDRIRTAKVSTVYNDNDAYAFGFYKNKAYIGDPSNTHYQIRDDLLDRGEITDHEYDEFPDDRKKFKQTGRLWTKLKIISFWNYPTQKQIKNIISKLEKASGLKMWNNGWSIEVIDKGGKFYRPTKKDQGAAGWGVYDETPGNVKIVPLEDYAGSQKQVGKELSHQKSPVLKKKKEIPMGLGSKKQVKGAKKGETPAAARHRLRKGLGDGIIKLKDLIKEIYIIYEDQSDELVKIARTQNGLIDPKGKVYAVPKIRHINFLVTQPKFKSYKKRLAQAQGNEYSTLYEAVIHEAMADGWVRISGTKNDIGFMATKKALMKNKKLIDDIIIFVESVVKRPIKVYRSEFMIRKPQSVNYNKDFGND
jgi:hypothetical protein